LQMRRQADEECGDRLPLLVGAQGEAKTGRQMGGFKLAIRKLCLHDFNPVFALNAELALRSGIGLILLGLPFLIPHGTFAFLDAFSASGVYSVSVVTFYMLNVNRTLGETLSSIAGCLRGLAFALLNKWVLRLMFPDGVTDDSPAYVFWIGIVFGTVFVTATMLLNLNSATKIVSVSAFLGWWMLFLEPGSDSFHFPFAPHWDPWQDTGVRVIVTTCIGAILAIGGCLLPYPLLALDNAKDGADELVSQMASIWRLLVEYLNSDHLQAYSQDRIYRNLRRLETLSDDMESQIDSAWWECFGFGRKQRIRRKLRRLDKTIQDSYDCIYSVWGALEQVEWGSKHADLMHKVAPHLKGLIDAGESLVYTCLMAVLNGVVTDGDEKRILEMIEKVSLAERVLCDNFRQSRSSLGRSLSGMVSEEELGMQYVDELALPHALVFNLSAWAHVLTDFAEGMVKAKSDPESLPKADAHHRFWMQLTEGVWSFDNRNHALRATVSVLISFGIGLVGFQDLVTSYNAGIAGTCVVLLSSFTGSAIVKNLGRVQGVVLGMVFGQIVKKIFGSCIWESVLALGLSVFAYSVLMVFVVHSGSQGVSYVGTLAAILGVQNMLTGTCAAPGGDLAIDKSGSYDTITCNVIACSVIVLVDLLFYPGRAASYAADRLNGCFLQLEGALSQHFDKKDDKIRERNNDFFKAITAAESLNDEASVEPRFWRIPWKQAVFAKTTRFMHNMRCDMRSLECCMADNFAFGGRKHKVMQALLNTKSFPLLGEQLKQKVAIVKSLCTVFQHESAARFALLDDETVVQQFRDQNQKLFNELLSELVGLEARSTSITMREDTLCQITMALVAIKAMFKELRAIQHQILRAC